MDAVYLMVVLIRKEEQKGLMVKEESLSFKHFCVGGEMARGKVRPMALLIVCAADCRAQTLRNASLETTSPSRLSFIGFFFSPVTKAASGALQLSYLSFSTC